VRSLRIWRREFRKVPLPARRLPGCEDRKLQLQQFRCKSAWRRGPRLPLAASAEVAPNWRGRGGRMAANIAKLSGIAAQRL